MVTKGANWRSPGTKYKRSKIAFAVTSIMIALSLGSLGPQLLGLASQSLIGSPGTLLPSHWERNQFQAQNQRSYSNYTTLLNSLTNQNIIFRRSGINLTKASIYSGFHHLSFLDFFQNLQYWLYESWVIVSIFIDICDHLILDFSGSCLGFHILQEIRPTLVLRDTNVGQGEEGVGDLGSWVCLPWLARDETLGP